jgi:hypothetical protein
MSLSERQRLFSKMVGYLIEEIYKQGNEVTFGEAWRTPQQAQWNAEHGLGIAHSLHIERLAIDLNLFKGGVLTNNAEDYKPYGDYWKTLHPDNNWGGDFTHLADIYHFSMSDGVSNTK